MPRDACQYLGLTIDAQTCLWIPIYALRLLRNPISACLCLVIISNTSNVYECLFISWDDYEFQKYL